MQPEGSLPYSQDSANGPYTEPDGSSPQSHIFSLKYVLILSSYLDFSIYLFQPYYGPEVDSASNRY
jgi:hypothetical protein